MISVIIPSKTISNLIPCTEAILEHERAALLPENIIVVDDAEGPEIAGFCEDIGFKHVRGEKPFIFARNVNIGIRAALSDTTCDGVIILNDDALLQSPNGFIAMTQACEDYPEFGLIGATCNNVGNPNQHRRGIGLRSEPRMCCFIAVYIPRSTIERVGLMDERYTKYGLDDDDYSFEVRKADLKIGVHDDCFVDHGTLKSSFRGEGGAGGDFRPNMKTFIEKWGHDNWGQPKETSQFAELFP